MMMKRLIALLAALLLPVCAAAEGVLAVPFAEDAPEYAAAEAVGDLLGRTVQSMTDMNGAEAVNAMLADPDTLLMDTQNALMLSLQGYTSADCREAMRPVCRIGVQPLALVMNRDCAGTLGIADYEGFAAYAAEHEYELLTARYVDASVVDYASWLIENALPVMSETCFDREEALEALNSETLQFLVLPLGEVTEELLPLCTLGSQRAEALPDLPCAGELGLPVCEGITLGIYANAEMTPEETDKIAEQIAAEAVPDELSPRYASGEAFAEETADAFAAYVDYMTAEGLFFYEQ